nr:hypothetical protein GCM10017547_42680 [Pseudarthrobacter oxydans]
MTRRAKYTASADDPVARSPATLPPPIAPPIAHLARSDIPPESGLVWTGAGRVRWKDAMKLFLPARDGCPHPPRAVMASRHLRTGAAATAQAALQD